MSYIRKITRAGQLTEEYKKYVEQQKRKIKKVEALKKDAEDKKHAELMEEMKEEAKQKRVQDRKNQKIRQQLGLKYNMTSTSQDIDDELKRLIEESPDKVLQAYESGNDELLLKKLMKMRMDRMDAEARAKFNADRESNEAIMMRENQLLLEDAFNQIRKEVKRMRKAIEKQADPEKRQDFIDTADLVVPEYSLDSPPADMEAIDVTTMPYLRIQNADDDEDEDEDIKISGFDGDLTDELTHLAYGTPTKEEMKQYLVDNLDQYAHITAYLNLTRNDNIIKRFLELTPGDYKDIRDRAREKTGRTDGPYKTFSRNNLIPERVRREHLKRMEKKKVGYGIRGGKQVMRNRIFDKIDNLYAAGLINKTQHKQMASQLI